MGYIKNIKDVFESVKRENGNDTFALFLDYFESQYLKKFPIESWNYYKNARHLTNNSCKAYNCKLSKLFNKKPSFFKLLYELRIEEKEISLTYERRRSRLLERENRRTTRTEAKINFLYQKSIEIDNLPENNLWDKLIKVKAWFDCIKSLGRGIN